MQFEGIKVMFTRQQVERHINTHSERSVDDENAVTVLKSFLRSNGKINTEFRSNDKWPNIDGRFELVSNPNESRRPMRNFFVQIKGSTSAIISSDNVVKYQLKDLAFPAFAVCEVTADPCILFVVLNPGKRGDEKVFYKYMSIQFLQTINFDNDSTTIEFTSADEIFNTDTSINAFAEELISIADRHSFVKRLELTEYTSKDILNLIKTCDEQLCEDIERISYDSRDQVSRRMLTKLDDFCSATLLLNNLGGDRTTLGLSWEHALTNMRTRFLSDFLQFLRYIGRRIPEEGQPERLMLKYYDYLWQMRKYLKEQFNIEVLKNLEKFPLHLDEEDKEYNTLVAKVVDSIGKEHNAFRSSRYYVQNNTPFYVDGERYFEITLQLAGMYATKYNRITVYTKECIYTNYSVQIGYSEADLKIWDKPTKIKILTNWRVSIDPTVLNKFASILGRELKISSKYGEYISLMQMLTVTGLNLLEIIDMRKIQFDSVIDEIYNSCKTTYFKDIMLLLHTRFFARSNESGRYVIRYLLLRLKEELIESVIYHDYEKPFRNRGLLLNSRCNPFDGNPLLYDLPQHRNNLNDVLKATTLKRVSDKLAYVYIKHHIETTGEIYINKDEIFSAEDCQSIMQFNENLEQWDEEQGCLLREENDLIYIDAYERDTLEILRKLRDYSNKGNEGQKQVNNKFIKANNSSFTDNLKKEALSRAFVDSKLMLIYGAAGTGKTTLMNYLSDLMSGRSKLFLAKTHTALENLQRRITSPGQNSLFSSIDSFLKSSKSSTYDLVFIDECSIIDNRTMRRLFSLISNESLLVLAGDIYQIESIEFGNWFYYAKDIIDKVSLVELDNTWRTDIESIKDLWQAVRYKDPFVTEKLVIDGPFSEKISPKLFDRTDDDEIVLCLNYDGRYGLNNINNYFQDANTASEAYAWKEWKYKIGDPILFNDTKRFPQLYNNLKGWIVDISKEEDSITFTVDIATNLTGIDARNGNFEILDFMETTTRIRFSVYENHGGTTEEEREIARMESIVPFQLAYAVSIHKSQGLEYNSVKIVIPKSNSEKVSHGVFYTAITRAKEKLRIYSSAETLDKIVKGFKSNGSKGRSLEIIKRKL